MGLRNTDAGWGFVARLLHWSMALLILGMSALGIWMTEAFRPGDLAAYPFFQMHKSWGFVVLALAVLRVLWRAANPTPALPAHMPGWERLLAHAGHLALYVLLFAMPVSGWLMVSASPLQDMGVPNMVFGLFAMPDPFVPGSAELTERLRSLHATLWIALAVLVGLHVLAALKHQGIDRDNVLRRMILGR